MAFRMSQVRSLSGPPIFIPTFFVGIFALRTIIDGEVLILIQLIILCGTPSATT